MAGFEGRAYANARVTSTIFGAIVGGFLFDLFGVTGVTGLDVYSLIVAIIGSVVVLLIYNALMTRRA